MVFWLRTIKGLLNFIIRLICSFSISSSSHMNEHTRKLLDDAQHRNLTDLLNDLEYDDIDINASDITGKTVLHYASIHK